MNMVMILAGCLGAGEVECSDACPPGTALAASSTVRVDAVRVVSAACAATCNPIEPCNPPNVPAAWREGESQYFECQALGGYGTLPSVDEIDTDFGETWAPVPEALSFSPLSVSVDTTMLRHVDRDRDGTDELFALDGARSGLWLVPTDDGGLATAPAGASGVVFADLDGDLSVEAISASDIGGYAYIRWCPADSDFFFDADSCVDELLSVDRTFSPAIGGAAADMDGDGDEDLMLITSDGDVLVSAGGAGTGPSGLGAVGWLGNIGYTSASPWSPAQVGDVDGDGRADVLLSSADGLPRLVMGGSGGWQAISTLGEDTAAAALADTDGDGRDEVVAVRFGPGDCAEGCIAIGDDSGLEDVAPATYGVPSLSRCRGVDWNGDGEEGMICADATAVVWRAGAPWDLPRAAGDYNGYFSAILALADGPALLWFLDDGSSTTVQGVRP